MMQLLVFIGLQVVWLFVALKPRVLYLFAYSKYKIYKQLIVVVHSLAMAGNIILYFFAKETMIYLFLLSIIFTGIILMAFCICARKEFFKELTTLLVSDNLLSVEPIEIRRYVLQKYEIVCSIDEINKCMTKINNKK